MARRQRNDLSVFESSCHLPICLPHTMEASHCPFNCWTSSREAVNTNFYSLWFDSTGNRTRVYRFSSRRSIHSTTDRLIRFYNNNHNHLANILHYFYFWISPAHHCECMSVSKADESQIKKFLTIIAGHFEVQAGWDSQGQRKASETSLLCCCFCAWWKVSGLTFAPNPKSSSIEEND